MVEWLGTEGPERTAEVARGFESHARRFFGNRRKIMKIHEISSKNHEQNQHAGLAMAQKAHEKHVH